jgi:hypothetical protein
MQISTSVGVAQNIAISYVSDIADIAAAKPGRKIGGPITAVCAKRLVQKIGIALNRNPYALCGLSSRPFLITSCRRVEKPRHGSLKPRRGFR